MEMHQVRYFLAVAQHLNFTRAAEACNVTQPSLTRAIKFLELEMGGELFHRGRTKTQLSELGRIILPHLKQVYAETTAAERAAKDFKLAKKAKLRLGMMCTIAPTMLVDLLSAVCERHPGIDLEIRDANARKIDKELLAGEVDVAIYCIPGRAPDERVHTMPLFRERMMIVLPPRHPLEKKPSLLLKDLDGQNYLSRISCEFNGYADRFFDEQGVDCETVYRSDRDDWILAMIRSGLGFGFMPEYCITDSEVVARPTQEPEFWRDVNLVTVRGRPHLPAVGALVREAMRVKWRGRTALPTEAAEQRDQVATLITGDECPEAVGLTAH